MTDVNGQGLYRIEPDGIIQVRSKYGFDCAGKSKGVARKYINRKFNIINWKGERILT